MKHKNHIDEQIEKTLNSLEGIQSAETDPYFLSRLKARMEQENTSNNPEGIWEFLLQPRMSLSIACFLIIVNIGLQDNVCPPETGYAVFDRIGSSDKKLYAYDGYAHDANSYSHEAVISAFFQEKLQPVQLS